MSEYQVLVKTVSGTRYLVTCETLSIARTFAEGTVSAYRLNYEGGAPTTVVTVKHEVINSVLYSRVYYVYADVEFAPLKALPVAIVYIEVFS